MRSLYTLLLVCFLSTTLFAKSELYFLPIDKQKAEKKIISLIKASQNSIDISMYNFSYKKFAKALVKASNKGVRVNVYLDSTKVKKEDKTYKYLIKKGIYCKVLDRKNHLKIALFDKKEVLFGSINWTKESFQDNYELLYSSTKKSDIKKSISLFNYLYNN